MNEKANWLHETGYKQRDFDGLYFFVYRNDDYRAFNSFRLEEVIEFPLDYMEEAHSEFLERAARKEIF